MKRSFAMAAILGMMFALVAASTHSPSVQAADSTKSTEIADYGKPGSYTHKERAFWLWYDNAEGWNIRTTGGKQVHQFEGRIDITGGTLLFDSTKGVNGESHGKMGDRCQFNKSTIIFKFNTKKGEDGFFFKVSPKAESIKFSVTVDGQAVPASIRLGKDGTHPPAATFKVPAQGDSSTGSGSKGKITNPTIK
jgi:hypothetical protein